MERSLSKTINLHMLIALYRYVGGTWLAPTGPSPVQLQSHVGIKIIADNDSIQKR